MRILFLHEVNYSTKPIFEMHEFPEYLAIAGHQVGFVHFPEGETSLKNRRRKFKEVISGRAVPGARLTLYTPSTLSTGLVGRLSLALTFYFKFLEILRNFRPDVVVSYAVPTSGWQALLACQAAGIPYVFRALDVSHKIRKSFFSILIRWAEIYIYSNSDWVSANNPAMLRYCRGMGAASGKSSVDFPPLELIHFDVPRDYTLRASLGFNEHDRIYMYMGTFFYFSGLAQLIQSFSKSRLDNDRLLLIGGGEQESELRDLVMTLNLQEFVFFTGFVNFGDLPRYLSIADVALNPMEVSLVSNAALPNKVIQYLAAGLPVVSTKLEGLQSSLSEEGDVTYVDSSGEVFTAAQSLIFRELSSPHSVERKELVRNLFDRRRSVSGFQALLEEVIDSHLRQS